MKERRNIERKYQTVIKVKFRGLELTNLDHKYFNNPKDWMWKCYSCHEQWDIKYNNKYGKENKK